MYIIYIHIHTHISARMLSFGAYSTCLGSGGGAERHGPADRPQAQGATAVSLQQGTCT